MKKRLKAYMLGTLVTACVLSGTFHAGEEAAVEPISEAAVLKEEAAEADADGGQFAPYYDQMKASVTSTLDQLSAMTDEQLQDVMDGNDPTSAAIAANWASVKEELGVFTGVTEQEVEEEGNVVTIRTKAEYDGVPENTTVNVNYAYDFKKTTSSIEWDIRYPASKLIAEAGLNTLLGLGTVFIVLVFLSLVIGNIHWIPDIIEKRSKKAAPAPAPAAPAPVPEPAPAEEDLTDDMELVAVIASAIASYEDVPANGFVVRSIKKANRRKWLGA